MSRPRLLDLFCGAGGAATGYDRAGFDVVGVDIKPQPRYPFQFIQEDALHVATDHDGWMGSFDAIHASPPCQAYSTSTRWRKDQHPDLILPVRMRLLASGLPFVIENVEGAIGVLRNAKMLCGSAVGLPLLKRHRLFEVNWKLITPPCDHSVFPPGGVVTVAGNGGMGHGVDAWREAMGISWMTRDELSQAIPPAYTELIGLQLLALLAAP